MNSIQPGSCTNRADAIIANNGSRHFYWYGIRNADIEELISRTLRRKKMAEFYVNLDLLSDATRPVHRADCAQLPATDTLLYLGSYASAEAAYDKATNRLEGVIFCPDCLSKAAAA
jgi:hypothetical protein